MYSTSTRATGGDPDDVFGFYVEKEYVGKRIKGSKVKVTWKFACLPDLKTNEVELKHSLVFGKREIRLNGTQVYFKKKMFTGDFHYRFNCGGHLLQVTIRDDFEGYVYDLSVDGVAFHRLRRIRMEDLEDMRRSKREAEASGTVKEMRYEDFVGKSANVTVTASASSATASKEDKKKKKKKDKKAKKAAKSKRDSSDSSNSDSSSSSSDSEAEEDLWNEFQTKRKQEKKKEGTAATPATTTHTSWTDDPFATGTSSNVYDPFASVGQDVPALAAGLEGLNFGTTTAQYGNGAASSSYNSSSSPVPAAIGSTTMSPVPPALGATSDYGSNPFYSSAPQPAPPQYQQTNSYSSNPYASNGQSSQKGLSTFNSDSITSLYSSTPASAPPASASSYGSPYQAQPQQQQHSYGATPTPPAQYGQYGQAPSTQQYQYQNQNYSSPYDTNYTAQQAPPQPGLQHHHSQPNQPTYQQQQQQPSSYEYNPFQ